MKFFKFLAIVLTLAIVLPAGAQDAITEPITIERDDIPNIEGSESPYYAVHFDAGQEINMTDYYIGRVQQGVNGPLMDEWDFSSIALDLPRVDIDRVYPEGVAQYLDEFDPAPNRIYGSTDGGFGLDIDNGLRYEFIDDNGLYLVGIETDPNQGLEIHIPYIEFDNPVLLLPFPATYTYNPETGEETNEPWNTNTNFTYLVDNPEDYGDYSSVEVVGELTGTAKIDAFGSLLIPEGTYQTIRVATNGSGSIEVWGHPTGGGAARSLGAEDIPFVRTHRYYTSLEGEIATVTSRADEEVLNFTMASKIRVKYDATLPRHFRDAVEGTPQSRHKLHVRGANFDGIPIPTGWEIGAFTPAGVLAGVGTWKYGNNIVLDNEGNVRLIDQISFWLYGGDDGFQEGEEIYLKMWDDNADIEYETSITVLTGSLDWSNRGNTHVTITNYVAPVGQEFSLSGWKIISLNNKPYDFFRTGVSDGDLPRLNIDNMILKFGFRNVDVDGDLTFSNKVNLLKTEDGFFAYPNFTKKEIGGNNNLTRQQLIDRITAAYPAAVDNGVAEEIRIAQAATRDSYLNLLTGDNGVTPATHYYSGFNNISYWDLAEGQQVNIPNGVTANPRWYGTPIGSVHDIPIARGYNIIPYYPTFNLSCGYNRAHSDLRNFYAINDIEDLVFFIKNDEGKFAAPRFFFSNLTELIPTQGYKIYVDRDVAAFNYPAVVYSEDLEDQFIPEDGGEQFVDNFEAPVLSSENMLVLVQDIAGVDEGVKIAAYNSSDNIVGIGQINSDGQCGMAVWGDDPSTTEVEGLKDGEQFELRISDNDHSTLTVSVVVGNGLIYKQDDFTVLSAVINTEVPDSYFLYSAFPNPFNSTTKISYGLPQAEQITINLYNIKGQEVMTLFEGKQQAGFHTNTMVADGLSSGLYFVRLQASNKMFTQKVMLVK